MDQDQTKYDGQNPYGDNQEYSGYGYGGNPFEDMDQDLCKKCHRRKIDRSENPQSVLCKDCREEYIKLRVPPAMKIAGIGVAAVVVLSLAVFGVNIMRFRTALGEDFDLSSYMDDRSEEESTETNHEKTNTDSDLEEAQQTINDFMCQSYVRLADEGMIVSSLDSMLEELEKNPDNIQMAITLTDVAMKYSYPDYAAYAIDSYLVDQYVSDEEYDRITGYIEELEKYYDTVDMVNLYWEMASELYEEEDIEIDVEEIFQEYHDNLMSDLGNNYYDQALLYYDLYYACMDEEEQIQHLKDCVAINPYNFDAQAQLAVYYRSNGEFDQARKILEESYAVNHEDYTLLRAYATLELVEGNLAKGLSYAESAYEIYPEGTYVTDTYLIALMANDKTEEAEELIKEWEDNGYIFDDDFYAFQKGDLTLKEYYTKD